MKTKIVVASALIGLATSVSLAAKTVQWTEKDPYFSMDVPESWRCEPKDKGDLRCKPDDNSGTGVNVTITKWTKEEHMNAQLPTLGEKLANAMGLKDAEHSKIRETTSSGKVRLWHIDTAGLKNGRGLKCWVVAFRTEDNPFVMLTGIFPTDDETQQKSVGRIFDSVAPVGSEEETKRSAGEFDPYKGSLVTLLPAEFFDSIAKFKRTATTDKTSSWKEDGAVEAVSFSYNQIAIVIVKIDGGLVNFATSADAVSALKAIAEKNGATVAPKGNGQRFTAKMGR